jgi:putative transposase
MHGILIFHERTQDQRPDTSCPRAQSLGTVIGQFKSDVTKRIWWNLKWPEFAWQPRFHDVILRKPADLERLRAYIRDNPARWSP